MELTKTRALPTVEAVANLAPLVPMKVSYD
jgi:hypothetical protein